MTATLADVRAGMADALRNGCGLRVHEFGEVDQINPPCALITRDESGEVDVTFGDAKFVYRFKIVVLQPRTTDRTSTRKLELLASPTGTGSLKAAVEDGDLWTVTIDYARVLLISPIGEASRNDDATVYLSVTFDVEVVF